MIKLKNIELEAIDLHSAKDLDIAVKILRKAVQTAIVLEHSTLPPYLTAQFSLASTQNDEILGLIRSVVIEEMLHLTIACNLLNSIGGSPVLNQPDFIPQYPGPLPGSVEKGLIVPIAKFSMDIVENVFMVIEKPEDPIVIESAKTSKSNTANLISQIETLKSKEELTIGEYYHLVKIMIQLFEAYAQKKGKTIFTGKSKNQVVNERWYPSNELFKIKDEKSAIKAINVIVDQGEGSSTSPFVNARDQNMANPPEPAHYYRFQEIVKGKKLVKDPKAPNGYSYSGDPIPFNGMLIPNMMENPKMNDYPKGSAAYLNSKLFNYNYTSLLNSLHITFNGSPDELNSSMGLMFALKLYASKLLCSPDPNNPGYVAGPSFEFVGEAELSPSEKEAVSSQMKA